MERTQCSAAYSSARAGTHAPLGADAPPRMCGPLELSYHTTQIVSGTAPGVCVCAHDGRTGTRYLRVICIPSGPCVKGGGGGGGGWLGWMARGYIIAKAPCITLCTPYITFTKSMLHEVESTHDSGIHTRTPATRLFIFHIFIVRASAQF